MRGMRTSDLGTVAIVVVIVAALQMIIPKAGTPLAFHPLVIVELLGLPIVLLLRRAGELTRRNRWTMSGYLILLVVSSVLNALVLLVSVVRDSSQQPVALRFDGFTVVAINMLSFAIIYWWLDAADPAIRMAGGHETRDFWFPQQANGWGQWEPGLFDYVYVSFTNLLAFSPTDTLPLTRRAKLLFMVQASISTFTVVVIVGHAINALPG